MLIRIEASELPGRTCGPSPDAPGYRNIHVGVQRRDRRDELLGLVPGDAASAVWELTVTATATATATAKDTGWDLRGPFVQGRPGSRFVYLSWVTVDEPGTFTMFRRAKLWFDGIDPQVLDDAVTRGLLVARLGLTDRCGHPLCAAVRPPLVTWSAPAP